MTATRRALVRTDPEQIVSTFPATTTRLLLPGVDPVICVMPPEAGWEGFGFRIADVVPAGIAPEGQREVGRTVALVGGVPTEVLMFEESPPPPIPDRVTSRQFFLQLNDLDEEMPGSYDAVMGWVALQSRPVRDAFERSGTFVRDDAMLQQGFAALGFTPEQIDGFFTAAAAL